ncbi:oxidoreductase [Nostoc sp. PCC 7107]|uniref:oxidoreductase n=1 Tax=Nostoc sp. PCC 7107 TaxID=317936 RepID=UPI00029F193C|nr:oxidoreductase [Nostoc sp. PCC 7107]AFY44063.1 3-oxoacyl-(acyl-carrier-protein) reductase [Nostoc sp. PCC 7107]
MVSSSISQTRVWLITGCSSGLGRALAETVLEQGETVVITARNPQHIEDLAAKFPSQTLAVQLDVTKPDQVQEAVKQAIAKFGRIDVLVNNAGCEIAGVIEEISDEAVRRMFETNFFGVLEMLRAVVPYMRQQRSGHIFNISSIACFAASPGGGIYGSTKLALEGISGSLANEVAPFGVKVTIVEPNGLRTDFFTRSFALTETQIEDYQPLIEGIRQSVQELIDGGLIGDPKKASQAIIQVADSDHPPMRLALGADTVEAIKEALEFMRADVDAWKEVSMSTDFDAVVVNKLQAVS